MTEDIYNDNIQAHLDRNPKVFSYHRCPLYEYPRNVMPHDPFPVRPALQVAHVDRPAHRVVNLLVLHD